MPKGRPNNKYKICDWCGQPFQLVASAQKRCEKCRIPARLELARRQSSAWYYNNPEKAKIRRQRAFEKHPGQYRETKRRYENRRRAQFRRIVIGFYTHGTYRCACCGEDEWDFLELDHINGGGRKENLRMFGRESSSPLYRWLRETNSLQATKSSALTATDQRQNTPSVSISVASLPPMKSI